MFFTNLPTLVIREAFTPLSGVTHTMLGVTGSRGVLRHTEVTKQIRCYRCCTKSRTRLSGNTTRSLLRSQGLNETNCPIVIRTMSSLPIDWYLGGAYTKVTARPMCISSGSQKDRTRHTRAKLIVAREMKECDALPYGAIQNGALLQLLDEAGLIFSAQHYSHSVQNNGVNMTTGYLESAEFTESMNVGEVVEIYAKVGYTSPQSVQVILKVMALNLDNDDWRVIGHARLWYTPERSDGTVDIDKVLTVPSQSSGRSSETGNHGGCTSYESMKRILQEMRDTEHRRRNLVPVKDFLTSVKPDSCTRQNKVVKMVRPIPSEVVCSGEGAMTEFCEYGSGFTMRLMDEVGCVAATNHSHSHCISSNIQSAVLLQRIRPGSRLVATSWPIFWSSESLEVKVEVDEQRLGPGGVGEVRERVAEGIVTCQVLDEYLQPMSMPEFIPSTDEEKRVFADRQLLHDERCDTAVGDRSPAHKSKEYMHLKRHSFNVGL